MQREEYVFAAIAAGLSLAERPTGIVMIPVILTDMALRNRPAWPELLSRMALCGLLAALGLLTYMAFLQLEFERPFAFVAGQAAWNQGTLLDRFVAGATLRTLLHSRLLGNGGLFLTFLGLTIASLRCFRFPPYGLGTLALPYFTLGVTSSMERFVVVCFPAFMCLAALCKQRPGSRIR
jgi:Gpi18-like mannosyltransferase